MLAADTVAMAEPAAARGLVAPAAVEVVRHYGGRTVVEATATIDDGALDLYSLELSDVWKLALMLRTFRSGLDQ